MTKDAVIYLCASSRRVATEQEAACIDLAQRHGVQVRKVFTDKCGSVSVNRKSALWQMHSFCFRTLDIGYVFVSHDKALARNNAEMFLIRKTFKNCGVEIVFAEQPERPNF